jgi:DNA-binding transcriptional LysR family regulator
MINYTLKQITSFESVVRLKSFTKASKELFITQPAVYMQIQELQKNIGADLLILKGKSVNTTYIGEKLYLMSIEIINLIKNSNSEIEQILDPGSGHISIAAATTTNFFVSRVLSEFKANNPKITFKLEVTNRQILLEKLSNNQVDLVIMGEPPTNIPLITQPLMKNPLIVISNPKHPLLKNKINSIDLLYKETLITREKGSGTRTTIERKTGIKFESNIEINSNEAIIEAVRAGLGIGFVSKHTVNSELKRGVIRQLNVEKFPIYRHWYIAHNAKNKLSPTTINFKKFITENFNL